MTIRLTALFLVALLAIPAAGRAETFNTCKTVIASIPATVLTQGVYCLNSDVSTNQASGVAINVLANNVTIDCNGYKIGGLGAGAGTQTVGIRAQNRQNVTVRNCNLRGFLTGIDLEGAGMVVEGNNLDQSLSVGILVSGDGNLIADNRIIDTGGGTGVSTVYGIQAFGNTDIRRNTVDGVITTPGSNGSMFGIRLSGGSGPVVAENVVRNQVPDGGGTAYGIYTSNGTRVFIDSNRVALPGTVTGSLAYRCNASNGAMRGNTSWSYDTGSSGCLDDGGNVAR